MVLQIKRPLLVVGVGDAGSRLAIKTREQLDCDLLLIRDDQADLASDDATSIIVDTKQVINPTIQLMRMSAYNKIDEIKTGMAAHPTVIMMGNLAGKTGCAVTPVVAKVCEDEGVDLLSFVIMPFGYEKSRLFSAGVALKRLRESSSCTVVLDNDSLLESNPDLTPKECYKIADAAITHVMASLDNAEFGASSDYFLGAGKSRKHVEDSLRDALKTLYSGGVAPGAVRKSMLYVVGGDNIPAGMMRSIAGLTEYVLNGSRSSDSNNSTDATAEATIVAAGSLDESRVVMLSTVQGMAKFEKYDPLGVISADKTLDWSMPECSIDSKIDLYQLE